MGDLYFWLGEDREINQVTEEDFNALQGAARERTRRWQEVDTNTPKSFYFYGIIEPADDDEEDEDDDDQWGDLFGGEDKE